MNMGSARHRARGGIRLLWSHENGVSHDTRENAFGGDLRERGDGAFASWDFALAIFLSAMTLGVVRRACSSIYLLAVAWAQ